MTENLKVRPRCAARAVGFALIFFLGSIAWSQTPATPALPTVEDEGITAPMFPPSVPGLGAQGRNALAASPPRVEMSLADTITDSLFGDVYATGRWKPLSLDTFFSEGWLEPWAGAPDGQDGRTPRHGWLGAFDGVFYRLWLTPFTYGNGLRTPHGSNSYGGNFAIFLPLSRRFDLLINVPFVTANGTRNPRTGYQSNFGDFTVTPRFLLSETERTSQVFAVDIGTPTGRKTTGGGVMSLTPRYEFWTNPGGPWVVRGATGVFVPLNRAETPAQTTLTSGIAVGRYFRPHDVPFGDLDFYAACNTRVPLDGDSRSSYVGIGPGTRFHITNNYFFLHYWEFPVAGARPDNYIMQTAIMKVF